MEDGRQSRTSCEAVPLATASKQPPKCMAPQFGLLSFGSCHRYVEHSPRMVPQHASCPFAIAGSERI